MTIKIPTLEEIDELYRTGKSPDLAEQIVSEFLSKQFKQLSELLKFEHRTMPENHDAVLTLLRDDTKEKVLRIFNKWNHGELLLREISYAEKVGVEPDTYSLSDILRALQQFYIDLKAGKMDNSEAVSTLKEIMRRSKGIISPNGVDTQIPFFNGHIQSTLQILAVMYPDIFNEAMEQNIYVEIDQ